MRQLIPLVCLIALCSIAARSFAQTQPAPDAQPLRATVTAVEGLVQVRAAENQPWQRAQVGMEVTEDAEFRTGPRSAVRFVISPDHVITLDRLGTVKVLQAVIDGGVVRTQLGMKYGRTQYQIEAGGRAHESTIATPSSTLAVRGTDFVAFDQRPFPARGVSLQGRVEFRDLKKRVTIGGVQAGKTVVTADNPNAPATALQQAIVDPGARLARSPAEEQLVNTLLASGATVEFDFQKGIRVVRGGRVPLTDQELVPTLPGTLNFVLRWQGPTDLNLGVLAVTDVSPAGETLYPIAGFDQTASGGRIPFDHRGGPNGGIEIGFWPGEVPAGNFAFGSQHVSGPHAPATIDVFRDGQRVQFTGPDGQLTTQASYTAMPIPAEIASGQAVGVLRLAPGETAQARPAAARSQRRR